MIARSRKDEPRDLRQQMIDETGLFLTWALRHGRHMPRIPRRRVDEGGFSRLMQMPGARAAVGRLWDSLLDQVKS